jgi:HEAT repeat protein
MKTREIKGLAIAIILMALSLAVPSNLRAFPPFDGNGAPDKAVEAYKKAYNLILNESWEKAISAFQEVIKQYPGNAVEDDAAFYICLAKEKSRDNREAVKCYGQFVAKYPKSTYVNDASANMTRLAHGLKATDPGIDAMVDSVKEKDINIKLLALQALIDSDGAKEALPVIIRLYDKSTKPEEKEKILYIMNDIDDPSVTVKLSEIVQKDPLPEMRKKAVYALGDHGGDVAVQELKKIVKSKNDLEVRKAALYSLANTDSPDVVTFLGEVARTETNEELAKAATYAIGDVESPESSQALQSILKSSSIIEVRKAALHALADHDAGMSVATLKATALNDPNEELRRTAVYAIADNESKESLEALKEILSTSKDPKVQESSLYALADHGGPGVQPVLMQTAISNPEEHLAKAAVYALADLTEGDTSLLLEVFRKSKFNEVRKAALYAISDHAQHKSAIESLSKILKEEKEEEYRVVALHALANVEGDEIVPVLANVAKNDSSQRVRTVAVQMLGQIGTPAAKKVLLDILEKE